MLQLICPVALFYLFIYHVYHLYYGDPVEIEEIKDEYRYEIDYFKLTNK